jgi:hypothetical protein
LARRRVRGADRSVHTGTGSADDFTFGAMKMPNEELEPPQFPIDSRYSRVSKELLIARIQIRHLKFDRHITFWCNCQLFYGSVLTGRLHAVLHFIARFVTLGFYFFFFVFLLLSLICFCHFLFSVSFCCSLICFICLTAFSDFVFLCFCHVLLPWSSYSFCFSFPFFDFLCVPRLLFHALLFSLPSPLALVCLLYVQLTNTNHSPGDDISISHNIQYFQRFRPHFQP